MLVVGQAKGKERTMETIPTLEDLITNHRFLTGLSGEFQKFLQDCATVRRFGSQQQVFQEGGEADHFYLIVNGRVCLETAASDGRQLIIHKLESGDALGWSWLFPPHEWCFTAVTAAPTEVLSFAAEPLRQKAAEDAFFSKELLTRTGRMLVERLQATRHELLRLYRRQREEELERQQLDV
jgi:CRP-like cAMP-binding protein